MDTQARARVAAGVALLSVLMLAGLASSALADKTVKCGTPTKGGTIKISVWGARGDAGTEKTNVITVTLSADSLSAACKARAIARLINATGTFAGVYEATAVNGQVTVNLAAGVGGTAKISYGIDTTKEGTDLSTCSVGDHAYCECSAPASGLSWDGFSGGSLTIGTSQYATTILTTPGQSPASILNAAAADLIANGITNVAVVPWGDAMRLHIVAGPGDTDFAFGFDDTGHNGLVLLTDAADPIVPMTTPVGLALLMAGMGAAAFVIARRRERAAGA